MADGTNIEWTDATWNPTVGCSVISAGCTNCYAMKLAGRLEAMGSPIYRGHTIKTKAGFVWNGKVTASNYGQMIKPLSWRKPRRIFVNSMSDLFHEDMPSEVIDQVFAVMALCPQHTFQVLTKRSATMRDYIGELIQSKRWLSFTHPLHGHPIFDPKFATYDVMFHHVWLGVSVEDQHAADARIPNLLATPATVRFLSCEPLLGPVDLRNIYHGDTLTDALDGMSEKGVVDAGDRMVAINPVYSNHAKLDWVIAGGESGPKRRPIDPDWMRAIRDQCAGAGVAFFGKQLNKVSELPPDLMIRQMPSAIHG